MTCTFFGHRDTPEKIKPTLRSVLIDLIENKNVDTFYVGNNGSFDRMVRAALKELKKSCQIEYYVVLTAIPKKRDDYDSFNDTIFPEFLEAVPYKYRIIRRNNWLLEKSDFVVTYITHITGGAFKFKKLAESKGKTVIDISGI